MTVNAIEHRLLQLLADAETPLYSAWRWLNKESDPRLPLVRFFELVDNLITRDQVQLWCVDFESHDRTEFFEVPPDVEKRYEDAGHDDEEYDPFGYSLALGPKAEIDSEPEWEVDIDFQEGTFRLLARNPDLRLDDILRKLALLSGRVPNPDGDCYRGGGTTRYRTGLVVTKVGRLQSMSTMRSDALVCPVDFIACNGRM